MSRTTWRAFVATVGVLAAMLPLTAATAGATATVTADRLAGDTRYATAAAVAQAAFPDGATDAVLARGDAFPDALAGATLAGSVHGPVLLTTPDTLDSSALGALDALHVHIVHVLGGTGAVSAAVVDALKSSGREVVRVAGENRFGTAAAVAVAAGAGQIDGVTTAIVASGSSFPDALAAGPLAAGAGLPIVLTGAASLAPEAMDALHQLGVAHAIVLGGTGAVSDAAAASLQDGGIEVERIAGASRAETAAAVADYAVAHLSWDASHAVLARSDEFADGLAGGPLGGLSHAPVLLTAPGALDDATGAWLSAHTSSIESITVLGGVAAVPDSVVDAALAAASGADGGADASGGPLGVSPTDPSLTSFSATKPCTIDAPDKAAVHVVILPASSVTTTSGTTTFVDANHDHVADVGGSPARIASVDGRTLSPPSDRADLTGGGELALSSTSYASAVAVAFVDGDGGTAGALDLDDTGAAVDDVAVGCPVTFAPAEAPSGMHTAVEIGTADATGGVFVDAANTKSFRFDAADSFASDGRSVSPNEFADLVSRGDAVDIDYDAGSGPSHFTVTRDTVLAPGTPVAVATATDGGTRNDASVEFTIPDSNGAGTSYVVTRAATHATADGCSAAIAATATNEGTTTTSPFVDLDVPDGCYIYRLVAQTAAGKQAVSAFSQPVHLPGSPTGGGSTRPTSTWAAVTVDGGTSGSLGNGDTITIVFSAPIASPTSASISVAATGGTNATFTAGPSASFSLNTGPETAGGASRPAGTVLTIHLLADPTAPVAIPTDIVASSGIADGSGGQWDLAASSDRRLDLA